MTTIKVIDDENDGIAAFVADRMKAAFDQGSTTPDPASLPANNLKFVGRDVWDKRKRKILRVVDPIEQFSDAGRIVKLPPADFQKMRRLFYHEAADLIASTFPNLYKIVLPRS